ncbi:MAG: site-specific recombinase [Burkholderiales bacterium]|nr:site-specific recombinase [Burkholderiales bacterium]
MSAVLTEKRVALEVVLDRFARAPGDPVAGLRALVAEIRPRRARDAEAAAAGLRELNALLESRADYREALGNAVVALFADTRSVSFYTDAGILPGTGFFPELRRRLAHRLLPEVPDPGYLKDAVAMVFDGKTDHLWFRVLPEEEQARFWRLVFFERPGDPDARRRIGLAMLDALLVLGYRVGAMGLEPELRRVAPDIDAFASPFVALGGEIQHFVTGLRAWLAEPGGAVEDEKSILVFVAQCEEVAKRARRTAAREGATLALTYLLTRIEQSLGRIALLAGLLGTVLRRAGERDLVGAWTAFFRDAALGIMRRDSVREQLRGQVGLLALRVTENAGRVGEHYIAATRAEYRGMWRSAAGAGLLIAPMALLKILVAKLALAPLNHAFAVSLNYGLGFVLIHMLHFTIATKQPAMTAATIAHAVSEVRGRVRDLGALANLVTDAFRSQVAAILGNVLVALPTALVLGFWLSRWLGHPVVSPEKAFHLLADLEPFGSLTLFYAATAGVYLFLAGLISGWVDNHAAYSRFRERVAALPWLRSLLGAARAERFAGWLDANAGGLAGNFLFGVMLGATATVGQLFGLPLDIRHIAFSSANFGYALVALDFALPWQTYAWSLAGIALIGFTNLTVSFALALWVALRSRGILLDFRQARSLGGALWRKLRSEPAAFLLPPRAQAE